MHISAKIQLKKLKQHFDWGKGTGPPGPPWLLPWGEPPPVSYGYAIILFKCIFSSNHNNFQFC